MLDGGTIATGYDTQPEAGSQVPRMGTPGANPELPR